MYDVTHDVTTSPCHKLSLSQSPPGASLSSRASLHVYISRHVWLLYSSIHYRKACLKTISSFPISPPCPQYIIFQSIAFFTSTFYCCYCFCNHRFYRCCCYNYYSFLLLSQLLLVIVVVVIVVVIGCCYCSYRLFLL